MPRRLPTGFFDRDACLLARSLVGKVLRRRQEGRWLAAWIVEAEAYYVHERGSHASLGRTPSREATFMPPGTIYMYYSRGGDSLNVSARGAGCAVLVKGALPHPSGDLEAMQALNPKRDGAARSGGDLCKGQTLLCKALGLRVPEWDQQPFGDDFHVADYGDRPATIQAARLGIPEGRDEQLRFRFVDADRARFATRNPLTRRGARPGIDYRILEPWRAS